MLKDYYPERLLKNREFRVVQEAAEGAVVEALDRKEDLINQLFIDSATWGLDFWEQAYGIIKEADKSLDFRRSRLRSKIRGQGTTTAKMIQNLAESFIGGEIEVSEKFTQYALDIKFISKYGTPPNIEDLSSALDEIIPAHIAYNYIFSYLLIRDISDMTVSQFETQTIDKFAF